MVTPFCLRVSILNGLAIGLHLKLYDVAVLELATGLHAKLLLGAVVGIVIGERKQDDGVALDDDGLQDRVLVVGKRRRERREEVGAVGGLRDGAAELEHAEQ